MIEKTRSGIEYRKSTLPLGDVFCRGCFFETPSRPFRYGLFLRVGIFLLAIHAWTNALADSVPESCLASDPDTALTEAPPSSVPLVIPELIKRWAKDGVGDDSLGSDVSTSGNVVIVGASLDSDSGDVAGAAYVLERTDLATWLEHKLVAGNMSANTEFGISVAISGDTAVIGAPGVANATGAAHVFSRENGIWIEKAASTRRQVDKFQFSSLMAFTRAFPGISPARREWDTIC